MESFRDDDRLAAALSALRPAPSSAFAATLDERVAAGFPRRAAAGKAPLARLGARLQALKPRHLLLPSAATALAAVAVATVVVATSQNGSPSAGTPKPRASAGAAREVHPAEQPLPESVEAIGGAGSTAAPSAGEVEAKASPEVAPAPKGFSGGFFGEHRDVEHSAEITLGTDPANVGAAAGQVFEAVHAAQGVVLRSSVQNGSAGHAGARFELLISSARLNDALAALSEIAEVRSRHDGTVDITAPTSGAGDRLRVAQARVEALLNELSGAETEAEREVVEAKLRSARGQAARIGAELETLKKRASLSRVSLRIVSGDSATGSGGGWDVGDAIGDAGHILAVAAGVTIVGLAVLGPIALVAFLIWAGNRAWVRRRRERALG